MRKPWSDEHRTAHKKAMTAHRKAALARRNAIAKFPIGTRVRRNEAYGLSTRNVDYRGVVSRLPGDGRDGWCYVRWDGRPEQQYTNNNYLELADAPPGPLRAAFEDGTLLCPFTGEPMRREQPMPDKRTVTD